MEQQIVGLVFLLAIASAILSGWLAGQKGRSIIAWVIVGLFLGPLGMLALIGAPSLKK